MTRHHQCHLSSLESVEIAIEHSGIQFLIHAVEMSQFPVVWLLGLPTSTHYTSWHCGNLEMDLFFQHLYVVMSTKPVSV